MAILMNTMNTNNVKGFAKHVQLRKALNAKLYEVMPVINKYTFWKDEETNEVRYECKLGTTNDSPVIREFGLSDKAMANARIEVKDANGNIQVRRVNVHPEGRHPLSENVILVTSNNADILAQYTRDGLEIDGERYEVASVSPSQEKAGSKFFARITSEVKDQKAIFAKIEKINGYVFSKGLFHKKQEGAKILKANARLGNYGSNMQLLATIDLSKECIAIVKEEKDANGNVTKEGSITGSFDYAPEVKAKMDAQGIKIDNHINDGACYLSTSVIKRIFASLDMKLTTEEALRVALQVRISHVTAKCMNRTLVQEDMMRIAKHYKAEFYGNTDGELALLVDEDGAKLVNEIDLRTGKAVLKVYVMAMANASTPHSSGQHLIKYLNADTEATVACMKQMTFDALDNYVTGQILDGNNNSTVYAQIRSLAGEDALGSTMLMEALIKDTITFATSAVAKNRLTLEGIYSHMMFDLTHSLTNGAIDNLLGINQYGLVEAYSADVCRKYAKEIAEIENDATLSEEEKELKLQEVLSAVVVKFPSAMPDEYEVVVYKTKKQMAAKIEALPLSNDEKEVLLAYFNRTPWGCTVFAPINSLKNKLAGADVDFDACMSDMSELKHILVNKRMKDAKELGYLTFISYKDIKRNTVEDEEDELSSLDI